MNESSQTGPDPPSSFWQVPLVEIERQLDATPGGLSSNEAQIRLVRYGANTLEPKRRLSFLIQFLIRLRNPLVIVLLVAAAISAMTGEFASFLIIVIIVFLGVVLDAVQEHRAQQAAERLKISVALMERVLRDGQEIQILAKQLVPGDVVLLAAGDLVPADGRILEAKDFFVNESLLTGESYPTEKFSRDGAAAEMAEATNAAFMGSSVISGSAKLLVCATGPATQLGSIGQALRRPAPPAALERGMHQFSMMIVRVTMLLVLFVLLVNVLFHRPLLDSFLFALALAVGLTPELLPMVVSVTLARGALRMAKERVIVKRLAAIHDLGSMDILCTDKTGTLTEAQIRVTRQLSLSGAENRRVLDLAWLNSHFESGLRSPLDTAILESGPFDATGWRKLDEVPFDFERRRVSVLLEREGRHSLIVKGAPEDVLSRSQSYEPGDGEGRGAGDTRPLDPAARANAQKLFDRLGSEGFRVLAIACRDVAANHVMAADERELVFVGFLAFLDPPKASARATIAGLKGVGVAIKILTGDNELVTRHVCNELDVGVNEVLTGPEISQLSDEALLARVEQANLFCRVTPSQKSRVIVALKRRGHVVGFLGDGINDAPSLHLSDAGISVESAADIARDAADIILLEKDLSVLERGVREGRRTFGNIMKYIMMGTSSNFGNMFSMAGASLILPFLPMLPVQVLLNNLLYDFSEVAIPMDEVDPEEVTRPRHWDMRFVRDFMLVLGPVSSLFDFLTFGLLLIVFNAAEPMFQTGWFVESLASQVLVIFVIRTRRNPLRSRPHPILAGTSIAVVAAGVLLPYTALGRWFGFVALPAGFLAAMAGMVLCYLILADFAKRWFFRRFGAADHRR